MLTSDILDGLPTGKQAFRRHLNRVLREDRGHGGGVVFVTCLLQLLHNRSFNLLAILLTDRCVFCWAKVGKAKLNTNPTRASSKRNFINSSSGFKAICLLTTCWGISLSRRG
jgi:hypothetical protein